jgi:hypothetical protein
MADDEFLLILRQGAGVWNQWRKENPDQVPDLRGASLIFEDLSDADLSGVDLSDISLIGANFSGANLSDANLSDTNLRGQDLSDIDLSGANLENADLTRSRFINCNLSDAVVENANVTDIDAQRLRGLPKPPKQLRIQGNDGQIILIGSEAREFFNLPAIVEVYVTLELTQEEFGSYHFHLGEIKHRGVAIGVYLVGQRHETGGSVLRFQAKSYDEIYQILPDLLAPFRMAEAIDWEKTVQAIPFKNRGEAITALVKVETRCSAERWRFAKQMATIFDGFRNAHVYRISEGRIQGLRIDLFTNKQVAERLSLMALPEPWIAEVL